MRPFFSYFGSKHKLARHLGPPRRPLVIEPFCGSAAFSTFWNARRVILIDMDPTITGIWRYLIKVSPEEILRIPWRINCVQELPQTVCQEARDLVGFWLDRALAKPALRRSNWGRQPRSFTRVWGKTVRQRIAEQVELIRDWRVVEGDYRRAPDREAHWHIDPPYQIAGRGYRCNGSQIDYRALADWCLTRRGFTQVCESRGATWLPFEVFREVNNNGIAGRGRSVEVLYEFENK
jgi:site-specific DNA-adenine methylase